MPGRLVPAALLSLLLLPGASLAAKPKALFVHPEFESFAIERISMVPYMDARVDTSVNIHFEKSIHGAVGAAVPRRGYTLLRPERREAMVAPDIDAYRSGDSTWIRSLPADTNRFALVICLEDSQLKRGFGTSSNIEISGALYEVPTGTILWRAKGIGRAGQGGLAGMMMGGANVDAAVHSAIDQLVQTLPKRKR